MHDPAAGHYSWARSSRGLQPIKLATKPSSPESSTAACPLLRVRFKRSGEDFSAAVVLHITKSRTFFVGATGPGRPVSVAPASCRPPLGFAFVAAHLLRGCGTFACRGQTPSPFFS